MRSQFIIGFLFIFCASFAQITRTPASDGLNGPVKTVKYEDDSSFSAVYDSLGRAVQVQNAVFSCAGNWWAMTNDQWFYTYNADGKLTAAHNYYNFFIEAQEPDEEKVHVGDYYYIWDSSGVLREKEESVSNPKEDPGGTTIYIYDSIGKLIGEKRYADYAVWDNDSLVSYREYLYNSAYFIVGEAFYVNNGDSLVLESITERMQKPGPGRGWTTVRNENGVYISSIFFQYDGQGRLTEELEYYGYEKTLKRKTDYEYNDRHKKITEFYYSDEQITSHVETVFNERGDVTMVTYFAFDEKIESSFSYAYEYDAYGNWTKVTSEGYKGEKCTTNRVISYWMRR